MSLYVFYIYNINHMSRKAPLFPNISVNTNVTLILCNVHFNKQVIK